MAYEPKDPFYRRAKKEGYRSRAAYKLLELNRRFRLIRPGDGVVDLGAAPGGWLQVAAELVGPRGKVVGVDTQPIAGVGSKNVRVIQADITAEDTIAAIERSLGGCADAVLSDLAPRLTGIHDVDASRSAELARAALEISLRLLKPDGNLVIKCFMSEELKSVAQATATFFRSLHQSRPEATRKGSSEIYLCARGLKQDPARAAGDFHP
jgi:23S rRNA (uridine2552-2'-O)-methyltransferase